MPSLSRFASIGYYMPAFGLLAVILLLRFNVLVLWCLSVLSLTAVTGLRPVGSARSFSTRNRGRIEGEQPSSPGVLSILTPVVISHMTGVALYTLPILSQQMAVQHFPVSETEAVVLTAIVIYTAGPATQHRASCSSVGFWKDRAGLEGAEAGGSTIAGCVTGLHCPHQLPAGLHPGSVLAAFITPHTPKVLSAVIMVLLSPGCALLYCVFQALQETPVSLQNGWMLFLSVISQGILNHAP
ncbi:hypothetical protein J4Q44_G00270960 [Coregonus suidteri]|uniref:Uncharacterized protein n=1 Tax=Coregonus suidteri TaxID=861788 RepID=A0AAN8LE24_9TELE